MELEPLQAGSQTPQQLALAAARAERLTRAPDAAGRNAKRDFATGLDARLADGGGPTHYDLTGFYGGVTNPWPHGAAGQETRSHLPQPAPTAQAQWAWHIEHSPSSALRGHQGRGAAHTGATAMPVAGQVGYALPRGAALNQLGAAAASGNIAACNSAGLQPDLMTLYHLQRHQLQQPQQQQQQQQRGRGRGQGQRPADQAPLPPPAMPPPVAAPVPQPMPMPPPPPMYPPLDTNPIGQLPPAPIPPMYQPPGIPQFVPGHHAQPAVPPPLPSIWSWTLLTTLPLNGVTPGDMITNPAGGTRGRPRQNRFAPLYGPTSVGSRIPHSSAAAQAVRPAAPTASPQKKRSRK